MTLLKKISTALLCGVAPTALMAQAVELRSSDGFISVEGEITGFNGVMVAIQTTVGLMNVPASEVVCYGEGCGEILASNDFGLTADAFADVVDTLEQPLSVVVDEFTVGFAAPSYENLYRTLAGAFAVASQTTSSAEISGNGRLMIENAAGNEIAILSIAENGDPGDIVLAVTSLSDTVGQDYAGPTDWANAPVLTHHMLGMRAFAVVTSADVGVDAITLDQLAAIYAGDITNWSQIDGADLPVMALQLPIDSEVRDELIAVVMEPAGKTIADNVLIMEDEASIADAISGFAGSISVVNTTQAGAAQVMPVAGSCGFAIAPSDFSIASGDYPLIRPVMARFTVPSTTSLIPEFLDFAAADVAQDLLSREGFVGHGVIFQAEADKNARLGQLLSPGLDPVERPVAAQMFQALFEAERLTPTMFGGAVSGPEAGWNRAMMRNLLELLLRPEYADREVIFAGFGESDAGPQDAIDQSARAAADLLAAFEAFAPALVSGNSVNLTSAGFGAVAPATCYHSQVDSPVRTRVEVWIK